MHANFSSAHAQRTHSMLILSDTFLGVLQDFTPVFFAWKRVGGLRGSSCSLPQPFRKVRGVVVPGFLPLMCRLAHQLLFPPGIWLMLDSNQSFPFSLAKFPVNGFRAWMQTPLFEMQNDSSRCLYRQQKA